MGTAAVETSTTTLTPTEHRQSVRTHPRTHWTILLFLFQLVKRLIGMLADLILRHRRCRFTSFASTAFGSQQQHPYSSRNQPMLLSHPPCHLLWHTQSSFRHDRHTIRATSYHFSSEHFPTRLVDSLKPRGYAPILAQRITRETSHVVVRPPDRGPQARDEITRSTSHGCHPYDQSRHPEQRSRAKAGP